MAEKPHTGHPSSGPVQPNAKTKAHESGTSTSDTSRAADSLPKETRQAPPAEEMERLKREAQQAKDQYLRTLAEFENTKKRLSREKDEFVKYASETMVRGLLPIVDSLDHALVAVDKQADPQAIIKGVHLIYRQLLGLLDKEGVKRIPTVGERFDPHKHEAIAQVEAQDGRAEETVVEEVQVGYTMHGRVIRPAMVKVAKKTVDSVQRIADSSGEQLTGDEHEGEKSQ